MPVFLLQSDNRFSKITLVHFGGAIMAKTTFAAISLIIVGLLAISFAGLAPMFLSENLSTKTSEYRKNDPTEQIKIFSAGRGDAGVSELENKVAQWLKDNAGVISITGRTQSGDISVIVITVWYVEHK